MSQVFCESDSGHQGNLQFFWNGERTTVTLKMFFFTKPTARHFSVDKMHKLRRTRHIGQNSTVQFIQLSCEVCTVWFQVYSSFAVIERITINIKRNDCRLHHCGISISKNEQRGKLLRFNSVILVSATPSIWSKWKRLCQRSCKHPNFWGNIVEAPRNVFRQK